MCSFVSIIKLQKEESNISKRLVEINKESALLKERFNSFFPDTTNPIRV